MSTRPLRPATLAGIAGAALLVVSLWLPWYTVDLSEAMKAAFSGQAGGPASGLLEGLVKGLLSAMPASITATGWTALKSADVALALLGAVALAPVLQGVQAHLARRLVTFAGLAATAIVATHAFDPPGPNGLVHVRPGVWAALAGAVLMVVGGLVGGTVDEPAASIAPFPSPAARTVAPTATASVPPPGFGGRPDAPRP